MATANKSGSKSKRKKTKGTCGGNRRTDFGPAMADDKSWWMTRYGALGVAADMYCRLRAGGQSQGMAYATCFGGRHGHVKKETLAKRGSNLERQPEIRARMLELRAMANDLAVLNMAERRALLAQTARAEPSTPPTYGNIISAIREDAILAGERKVEGQASVSIDLSNVLLAISGESSRLKHADTPRQQPVELVGDGAEESEEFDKVEPVTVRKPQSYLNSQPAPTLDNPTQTALIDVGD